MNARCAAVLVAVAGLGPAGCTGTSGPPGNGGNPTQSGASVTDTAKAEETLGGLAADLRKAVDAAAKIPKSFETAETGDFKLLCGDVDEEWPAQWSYGRRVFLRVEDSRPAVEEIVTVLEQQGWTITRDVPGGSDTQSRVQAWKDGSALTIAGTVAEPGQSWAPIGIIGDTACVNADGSYPH